MEQSILNTVKDAVGQTGHDHFDGEILMHINSAISVLTELGIGPKTGFVVTGSDETWDSFLVNQRDNMLNMAQEYVCLSVRVFFDSPSSSYVMETLKERMKELEWRMNAAVDPGEVL